MTTTANSKTFLHVPYNSPPHIAHASNHDDIRALLQIRYFENKNLKIPFRDNTNGYFAGWISVLFDEEGRLKNLPRNENATQLVGDVAIAVGYTYAKTSLLNLEDVFDNQESAIQFLQLQNDRITVDAQMNAAVAPKLGDRPTSIQELLRQAVASTGLAERASQIHDAIRTFPFKREKLQQEYDRLFC
ncbi:hypothetical protein HDV00_000999 [Rhizophlyctis rosea]|nr:hypothetical protein HDV00_000999 [Rhizophlyctis rosea]